MKNHTKARTTLRIAGAAIMIPALVLIVIGMTDFFSSAASGEAPRLFFLLFIGMPLLFAGAVCLLFGFMGALQSYAVSQTVPAQRDAANYMLDGTREEVVKTVRAVKDDAAKDDAAKMTCPHCGGKYSDGDKFCPECGAPVGSACPSCGAAVPEGAKFCPDCGARLGENEDRK